MKTTPQTMAQDFDRLFTSAQFRDGELDLAEVQPELTPEQLWLLVKFAKYVRLRARNNTAFNNLCNQVFPYARFTTVTKARADGSSYLGLKIEVAGQEVVEEETE